MESKTVLCVADESSLHDIRQQVIQSSGFSVLTVASGKDAVNTFVSHPVDAVVLDCALPDADWANLTTTVKKLKPRIPVILLGEKPPIADTELTMVDAFIPNKASNRSLLLSRLGALVTLRSHSHSELEQEYVVFADASRHYLDCSDGVCALLGYSRMELVGMTIEDVSYCPEEVPALFEKFVKRGELNGEYILRHKAGTPVPIHYRSYVFQDGCIAAVWEPAKGWKELYASALVELNPEKLKERIEAAHAAIEARLHELTKRNQKASDEWLALHDALGGLAILRREITRRRDGN
jgi:CheY-like chemotaxis protein